METQTDILKTLLGQEIGAVLYGSSQFLPFEDSNRFHIFNDLALIVVEKQKIQLLEYKLIASNPIYKHHDNRCKLLIRKHAHEMKEKILFRSKEYDNHLTVDLKVDRIWLIENSSSAEHLAELNDYPTLTSTIAFEDISQERYLVVTSHRGQYESHMKRITVKFGPGIFFNRLREISGMESHIVSKFEC